MIDAELYPREMADGELRPVLKKQAIFVGASFGAGLLVTLFVNAIAGMATSLAIFVAAIFYIRWRRTRALRSLGFSDERAGAGTGMTGGSGSSRLKYVCIPCGAEVKGKRCTSCGSAMKKPLF
jgi:hypothetical protein